MKYLELPEKCPVCDTAFSKLVPPKRKTRPSARLLVLAGTVLCLPWGAGILRFFSTLSSGSHTVYHVEFKSLMAFTIALFAPLALSLLIASKMSKLVTLKCYSCKWSKTFAINGRSEQVTADEA